MSLEKEAGSVPVLTYFSMDATSLGKVLLESCYWNTEFRVTTRTQFINRFLTFARVKKKCRFKGK